MIISPFGLLQSIKNCTIALPDSLRCDEGIQKAMTYLKDVMAASSSLPALEGEDELAQLWQADGTELLTYSDRLVESQNLTTMNLTSGDPHVVAPRVVFLRMKVCIHELENRFRIQSTMAEC